MVKCMPAGSNSWLGASSGRASAKSAKTFLASGSRHMKRCLPLYYIVYRLSQALHQPLRHPACCGRPANLLCLPLLECLELLSRHFPCCQCVEACVLQMQRQSQEIEILTGVPDVSCLLPHAGF